jgi:hypothetical protein
LYGGLVPHKPPDKTFKGENGMSDAEAFLAMIGPRRRNPEKPPIDDEEYIEMVWRMVRALEARAIGNPALLPQVIALAQRLAEVTQVTIAANAARHSIDARKGASIAECAALMGVSRQAAQQRRAIGDRIMADRVAAAGAVPFAEAKRERQAIHAAAEFAVVQLSEYRSRHAA